MNTERYTKVKLVFLEAAKLPAGKRTGFIVEQCAGDEAMEKRVRRLLAADREEGSFLEEPIGADESIGLAAGTRLGGFTIVRTLGEGGMGIVYEAEEDEPRRRVALKLVRPSFFSERLRSRFRHEIRVLAQLQHPGIARIFEAGTLELAGDRVPYFAMELVRGRPLVACAAERGLSVAERLILVAQVCDAVHHAHQKGVIHRDLKPANILVEERGEMEESGDSRTALPLQVKVLDFGVARATDSAVVAATAHTDAGQMIGTLAYMSPEQAAGEPEALDIRSDVYSIGVIAFELLTGRLPYGAGKGDAPELVGLVREGAAVRLGSVDRSLRGDVATIIAKALEPDPARRYQSAAEMAADLRRYLRDEPIAARPASALYQLRKFAARHRPIVAAAAVVAVALVGATAVSVWQARIAERARALAEARRQQSDRNAEAALDEAARAKLAGAVAAIQSGDPISGRAFEDSVDASRRGWAWRYWNSRLDESIAMVRPAGGGKIVGSWLAPGGDEVAMVTEDGRLWRGSAWSGELGQSGSVGMSRVEVAEFNAEGTLVLAASEGKGRRLCLFDAHGGGLKRELGDLPHPARLLAVSGDGSVAAAGVKRVSGEPIADDVWVWAWGAPGRLVRDNQRTSGLAMTPDGSWVICGYQDVFTWDTRTGKGKDMVSMPRGDLRFACTADGSTIAAGGEDKLIRIWDRASGRLERTLRGHSGSITALAFDEAGKQLASAADDLTVRWWDATTGDQRAVFGGHTEAVQRLAFSADGSRLMSQSSDGTARLWSLSPDEGVSVLRGHGSYVYGTVFTPDGSRIVSGAWDGTVRVWDAAGGACLRTIPTGDAPITALAVSPDGSLVATGHKIEEWRAAEVQVREVATGRLVREFNIGRGEPTDLVFSRDGRALWAAATHGGAERIDWRAEPVASRPMVTHMSVYAMAVSPDERWVACGGVDGLVAIRDARTGEKVREFRGHRGTVRALAFDPTMNILASGAEDGDVRLWNPETGECLAVLHRHWDKVYALAFSPDGTYLASGSEDTTIRIWRMPGGEELTQLRGHEAYVYSLAFSPDGSRLVSGSGDHTVRVWDTRPLYERWRARMAGR